MLLCALMRRLKCLLHATMKTHAVVNYLDFSDARTHKSNFKIEIELTIPECNL